MKSLPNHGNVEYLWEKTLNLAGVGFLGHHIKVSTCADELVENYISATGKS